ncbi:hypothetical protein DPEC_G00156050 [Dallia pectoralis]|uniref:Uncharacterized protein n=1 Tax=Dallia pectoralis TaxID=75939 RepID=A0ACC2GL43_DALPE|nr:hypothetical protein DPEC_G00156050 [Dallia pectoralis]
MLEVQEERATAGNFSRKERAKKEREEAGPDIGRSNSINPSFNNSSLAPNPAPVGTGPRNPRAKAKPSASPHQHLNPPSVSLGSPSMHSSNPKVRNSPSANTQSSPKQKQEAMVRSPPVMSPSSAAQMDSKLPNQGKPGGAGSQSQPSPCDPKTLGPKGPVGSLGLKNGQGLNAGNGAKGKMKRERTTSVESFEQRETGTPNNDGEQKELGSRAKRLCVAERRQPYSGADWCSGGESDEEDPGFFNCNSTEMKPLDVNNTLSSAISTHNAIGGQSTELVGSCPKPGSKVVYVFTTEMANKAADAVFTGHSDNIIAFHMNNVSNGKGCKSHLPVNNQMGPPRVDLKLPQQSSHLSEQNHQQASKASLPGQQQPASAAQPQGAKLGSLPQDGTPSGGMDSKNGSPLDGTPRDPNGNPGGTPGHHTPSGASQPGFTSLDIPKGAEAKLTAQQQQQLAHELMSSMGDNPEGLSQEQLEHRERSLQTLRDIQRMLFPDDKEFSLKDMAAMGQGNLGGPPGLNAGMMETGPKKPGEQGPLQAMMAQSQSLGKPGGPGGPRPEGPPFGPGGPREMAGRFSPDELGPPPGPPMNSHGGPGGDHGDHTGMNPEQMAWMKLQQEFYEEKKRKQEQMQHRGPIGDMMMHQQGPRGPMMRGPPPPYQINSAGEIWGPGGPEHYPEQMHMGPRGPMHPQMQRMPGGFPPGMINPDMEGGPNPRGPRPGMNWPEDMVESRGFPPGQGPFGGPGGRVERFPNPQAVQEALFQQGMGGDKQGMGLPPGMIMEMNRMMGGNGPRGPMDGPGNGPGNGPNGGGMMFPRIPGDVGPMSPSSRMEFVKGLGREMGPEFSMGPGNMNMGPNPQMMQAKMRGEPLMNMSPEEMMKMRGGPLPENMGPHKMMHGPPFPDQGTHPGDFNMGPNRHFQGMGPHGPGPINSRGPRGEPPFGPDQRGPNHGGNGRLSHMPPNSAPNLNSGPPSNMRNMGGRKGPQDIQSGQANSPNVNPLKSPTLRQVQSPMLGSPSGNLKSPQTPSQLAGMLQGASAAAVAAAAAASSIKSPPMLGSAGASPVHMKSPSLPAPSPGWTSSPKPPMQSPGIPQNNKQPPHGNMMGNMEQGGNAPSTAPPSTSASNQPGPMNVQSSLPSGSPYALPPEPTLSQNPLSIMMSRMSKFAMPSSTPLYHDAIKTVASSDDDSPPARSPNLPSMNNMSGMAVNHLPGHNRMMVPTSQGPMAALSPMGMNSMGSQPLSHGMPNQMPSPNPMGGPHQGPMGPGMMGPHGMMMPGGQDPGMGNPQMMPQGRMSFPHRGHGFPPGQSPPQHISFPHNGPGPQGGFPHGMGFQGDGGPMGRMGNMGPGGDPGGMCKPNASGGGQDFNMFNNDNDLHEVMRTGATGMPEFDLSRIIPSEKPSQTLSYFPRGDGPGGKPPHPSGPQGFPPQMQGMMGEGNPRMGMSMQGMGGPPGPGPMGGPQDMPMGNHNPMRQPHAGFMPQGMMGPQHRMLSSGQQPGMMGGPGMMMQGKERGGPMYNHPGPVGSPNMMMSLHGMGGPQQTMGMPPQMRPRGMAGDMGMGFNPVSGNPGNLMF